MTNKTGQMVDQKALKKVDQSTDKVVDMESFREAKMLYEISQRINPQHTREEIYEAVEFFKANETRAESSRKCGGVLHTH